MAINFPASPSTNDTFTAGSITYKWDGAKWIGLGVTPADRLVEGSNNLEINASNNLVWTGNNVQIGPTTPTSKLTISSTTTGTFDALNIASGLTSANGYQVGIASSGNVFHWNTTDSWMNFATNNAERFRITEDGDFIINNNLTPNHSTQAGSIFLTKPSEQTGNPSRGICWSTTSDTHYVKLEPTVIDGLVVNGYSGVAFATGSRSNSTWAEEARITTDGLLIKNDLTVDQAATNVSGVGTSTVSNVVKVGARYRVNLYQTSNPNNAATWYLHIARNTSSRTSGTVEILQHGELGGQQTGNGANYYKALWSSFNYIGPGSISSVITDNVDAGGNTSRGITGVTVSQSDDEIIYAINSNWYGAIDVIIEWINEGDLQYQLDQTSTAVF